MHGNRPRPGGLGRFAVPFASTVTGVVGVGLLIGGTQAGSSPPRPPAGAAVDRGPQAAIAAGPHAGAPRPLPFSPPTRVRIPALAVDAPVVKVTMDKNGWVGAPPADDPALTGWFTNAAAPGQLGTAVIDGHVDTLHGPAIFYRLGTLRKGDRVEISRADGQTAVFTVYGVELFAKNSFPSSRVYGSTGKPELRVITCGGGYTKQGGYDGNVVVFARLSQVRRSSAPVRPVTPVTPPATPRRPQHTGRANQPPASVTPSATPTTTQRATATPTRTGTPTPTTTITSPTPSHHPRPS